MDRGAVGSSMMSVSSNDEKDSIARRTNQSRNNSTLAGAMMIGSMDETAGTALIGAPQPKKDHRKYDKDKDLPYLSWNEFLTYMDD